MESMKVVDACREARGFVLCRKAWNKIAPNGIHQIKSLVKIVAPQAHGSCPEIGIVFFKYQHTYNEYGHLCPTAPNARTSLCHYHKPDVCNDDSFCPSGWAGADEHDELKRA